LLILILIDFSLIEDVEECMPIVSLSNNHQRLLSLFS